MPVRSAIPLAAIGAVIAGGCSAAPRPGGPAPEDEVVRLVVAERGPSGGRLVAVEESGQRVANLTRAEGDAVRDASPAFSPDGRWVAFVSSRGRAHDESSLWVTSPRPGAEPVRLTDDAGVDLSPAWTPDGGAIVFASSRGGGIDLWRIAVTVDGDAIAAAGDPEPITELPGFELSPSIARDGRIAFTLVEQRGDVTTSRIAVRSPDGAITDATAGPADSGPAWTPDGAALAFTAPSVHEVQGEQVVDGDLWLVPAGGGEPVLLLDLPATDELAPVWSKDGRWLFATSIYRSRKTGQAAFSSIVYVDREAAADEVRILVDPAGAVPRIGLAVAPTVLDAAPLMAGPAYGPTLTRILRDAAAANEPR